MLRNRVIVSAALLITLGMQAGCIPIVVGQRSRVLEHVEGPLGPSGTPVQVVEKTTKTVVLVAFPPSVWGGEHAAMLLDDPDVMGRTSASQVSARASKYLRACARRDGEGSLSHNLWQEFIDDVDGQAHTHILVSYDPIVVVVTATPYVHDAVYEPGMFGQSAAHESGPTRPLSLPNGLLATHRLGTDRPVAWYSPTRRIRLVAIEESSGAALELRTARERFVIDRDDSDESWVVRREPL